MHGREPWGPWEPMALRLISPARRGVSRVPPGPVVRFLVIGLMVPSVDRVGRYFPLTLVAELPESVNVISAASETRSFFHTAERLVVETLATERVDFEAFDARVVALRDELATLALPRRLILEPAAAALVDEGAPTGWQIPIGVPGQLNALFEQLLSLRLATLYDPLTLWWTEGSSAIEPSCLIGSGLPHPDTFAALLDGSWTRHQWVSLPARVEPAPGDTSLRPRRFVFDRRRRPTSAGYATSTRMRFWSGRRSAYGQWRMVSADTATATLPAGWSAMHSPISIPSQASRPRSMLHANACIR